MTKSSEPISPERLRDYQPPSSVDELVHRYNAGERYFWDVDIPVKSDLRNITLAGTTFDNGWLSEIDFRGANLQQVRFLHCNVKCSDFRGADLEGAIFTGTLIEATYFENANLTKVSFAGASCYGMELNDDMPDSMGRF